MTRRSYVRPSYRQPRYQSLPGEDCGGQVQQAHLGRSNDGQVPEGGRKVPEAPSTDDNRTHGR